MIRKKNSGFSLIELMVVISMLAILSSMVIPRMIAWRRDAQLRTAVSQIRGDLQKARYIAIKQNKVVRAQFLTDNYVISIEGGPVLSRRNLPAGVSIDLVNTTLTDDDADGNPDTSFNGRGVPVHGVAGDLGNVVITDSKGTRTITINIIGRIQII